MSNAKYILTAIILFASASLYFTAPAESKTVIETENPEQQTAAPKYALLVGINDYVDNENWADLTGTHNDVALMKSFLVEKGNDFVEEPAGGSTAAAPCGSQKATSNVKTLCSQQATRKNILEAFDKHLIGNAKSFKDANPGISPDKGPVVVFYYSGHGGYVKDNNGDETGDGLDETLVPHDTDPEGTLDIRDDEIESRVAALKEFTTNIVIFADSCHSGTISRDAGTATRKGIDRKIDMGTRGEVMGGLENLSSDNSYVTISGSLPSESSYEDYLLDPVTKKLVKNGLLTYYFIQHARANTGASYRDIMNLVKSSVSTKKAQTPQAEGDIDRAVFGSSAQKVKAAIYVHCEGKGSSRVCSKEIAKKDDAGRDYKIHKIKMQVGTIVGARLGGPIAIYSKDARELAGETHRIGTGTITKADEFESEAEITLIGGRDKAEEGDKIVLISPSFTDAKRKVALDFTSVGADPKADKGFTSITALAENLKESDYLSVVRAENLFSKIYANNATPETYGIWDVAVVRSRGEEFLKRVRPLAEKSEIARPSATDDVYYIAGENGAPLYNFWAKADSSDAATRLRDTLEKHVRIENLRLLGNEASSIKNKIKINLVHVAARNVVARGSDQRPLQCKVLMHRDGHHVPNGQAPRFKVDSLFGFYVTNNSDQDLIVYIFSLANNGAITQLHPADGIHEPIGKGKTISSFGANECRVFWIDPSDSLFGKETIKIIATDKPIRADLITQPAIKGFSRGPGDFPLTSLIGRAATQSRNAKEMPDVPVSNWTTINFDYEIVP